MMATRTEVTQVVNPFAVAKHEEDERAARLALRTYYGYVQAYELAVSGRNLFNAQTELQGYKALASKPRGAVTERLAGHLLRSWFTIRTMETSPVNERPELAIYANFWAPVQAYYAVHGAGLAALLALGHIEPGNHTAFCRSISERIIARLMPQPFNYLCSGNTEDSASLRIENWEGSVEQIRRTSNLRNPLLTEADCLIAKALVTTRERELERRFSDERKKQIGKGRRRRNLAKKEKDQIASTLHLTSVVDFLYRLRVRSNYDNPEMYIYGQTDAYIAQEHYSSLLEIIQTIVALFERIIELKVGPTAWSQLETRRPT